MTTAAPKICAEAAAATGNVEKNGTKVADVEHFYIRVFP